MQCQSASNKTEVSGNAMNVDGARPIYLANLEEDYVQQGRFWLSLYDGENCPFAMANVKLPVVFLRAGSTICHLLS